MLLCCSSPGEICCYLYLRICAVSTVRFSKTLLCYILPGEMCCCLYLRTCTVLSQLKLQSFPRAEGIAEWTPRCLHYSLYSWRKSEQVFPRDVFLRKRLIQIFFPFIQHPFFLSCKYQLPLFVKDISVTCNSCVTQCFFETILSLVFDSVFLTGC